MQNNETEVMNKEEVKFTDVQVLSALGELDPEVRSLLMEAIKIDNIIRCCNDEQYMMETLNTCNRFLDAYRKVGMGVMELAKVLENPQNESKEDIMSKMIETYSTFSREDKLEFNKRTNEKNDLLNSLDLFGYSLSKFLISLDRTV